LHFRIASPIGTVPAGSSALSPDPRSARRFMLILADSVLPAPDSPEITIAYLCLVSLS
jgi:hypothetical protein